MKLTLTLEHNGRTAERTIDPGAMTGGDLFRCVSELTDECEQPSLGEVVREAFLKQFESDGAAPFETLKQSTRDDWERVAQAVIAEAKRREGKP